MKKIRLNFLGKDSVTYDNTIEVPDEIYAALEAVKNRNPGKKMFENADVGTVTKFLNQVQKGITPKNLRTVVCNEVLINELKKKNISKENTESEKLRAIFEANLEIAKTMNHQKNVSKNQKEGEQKADERIKKCKERIKVLKTKHKEKIERLNTQAAKFKIAFKGQKLLKEKLDWVEEQKSKLTVQMEKALLNAEKAEFNSDKKKLTKDIALGTSLSAYADPKLLYSYLKYIDLPIEKIYTPGMRKAFSWAESVDENYWRNYPS